MSKKLPLLISTLSIFAGGLTSAAWADEGPTSWTYEEMAALNVEMEAEINEACSDDDPMCRDSYIYSKSGDIYRALGHYREHGLTVTAINPYDHIIRVAYTPGNISFNPAQKPSLRDLYIVQGDDGYYIGDYVNAIEHHDAAGLEHVNVLFTEESIVDSDTKFPDKTEVELSTPELSIAASRQKIVNVTYRTSNPDSAWADQFDFSGCLASLEEGMECRIMYEANGPTYVATGAEKQSNATDDTSNMASTALNTNSDNTATASDAGGEKSSGNNNQGSASISAAPSTITTPDTGAPTGNYNESANEFPWWLGAIIATGVATLAWLFWPHHKKSPKKS